MKSKVCSIDGCERSGKLARGWCLMHYSRWKRHGDPLISLRGAPRPGQRCKTGACSVEGCSRMAKTGSLGWCRMHYLRIWKRGEVGPVSPARSLHHKQEECSAPGCSRPGKVRGFCQMHYCRWKTQGDPAIARPYGPRGMGTINSRGYRILTIAGRQVPEHRKVMEDVLGRSLLPTETVHHKDRNRSNNDPENLEVMDRSERNRLHAAQRRKDSTSIRERRAPEHPRP